MVRGPEACAAAAKEASRGLGERFALPVALLVVPGNGEWLAEGIAGAWGWTEGQDVLYWR